MVRSENDCVGCPQGCINCGLKAVKHYYCDECGEEIDPDDAESFNGMDLCIECFEKYVID